MEVIPDYLFYPGHIVTIVVTIALVIILRRSVRK